MFDFGDIRLRPIEKEDLKLIHDWENDFELMMYSRSKPINFVSMAQLEKQYEDWVKDDKELHFIVELKETREAVGVARIEKVDWGNVRGANLGTYIGKKQIWGKGVGKQITVALLEMSFNHLNMDRCEAWSVEYNQRAHKALEACGFKKGGAMRSAAFVGGRTWDGFHFDILKEEYLSVRIGLLKELLSDRFDSYVQANSIRLK